MTSNYGRPGQVEILPPERVPARRSVQTVRVPAPELSYDVSGRPDYRALERDPVCGE